MNSIPDHLRYWLRYTLGKIDDFSELIPSSHINNGVVYALSFYTQGTYDHCMAAGLINALWLIYTMITWYTCRIFATSMSRPFTPLDHKSTVFKGSKIFLQVIIPFRPVIECRQKFFWINVHKVLGSLKYCLNRALVTIYTLPGVYLIRLWTILRVQTDLSS